MLTSRTAILRRLTTAASGGSTTLPALLPQWASSRRHDDALYAPSSGLRWTFRELHAHASSLASGLAESGILPGDTCVLAVSDPAHASALWLASGSQGLVTVVPNVSTTTTDAGASTASAASAASGARALSALLRATHASALVYDEVAAGGARFGAWTEEALAAEIRSLWPGEEIRSAEHPFLKVVATTHPGKDVLPGLSLMRQLHSYQGAWAPHEAAGVGGGCVAMARGLADAAALENAARGAREEAAAWEDPLVVPDARGLEGCVTQAGVLAAAQELVAALGNPARGNSVAILANPLTDAAAFAVALSASLVSGSSAIAIENAASNPARALADVRSEGSEYAVISASSAQAIADGADDFATDTVSSVVVAFDSAEQAAQLGEGILKRVALATGAKKVTAAVASLKGTEGEFRIL